MTEDLPKTFLTQTSNECFPSNGVQQRQVREKAFLSLRFHPDNLDKQHRQIAKEMEGIPGLEGDCQTAINTTCQNVVRAVVQRYEAEMRATGVDVDCLLHGQRGQRGPWEKVYSWLYTHKFPQWRLNWIWQTWQQQAQPNHNWISFEKLSFNHHNGMVVPRKMVVPPPPLQQQIEINKSLLLTLNFGNPEGYLLLLNRGLNSQGEETRYLVCPSQAFAPRLEPVSNFLSLPQPEAMMREIKFDAVGKEEYVGIVFQQEPIYLTWMIPSPQDPAPIWNATRVYELWRELEKRTDWQVFFQSFEAVSS